MKIVKKFLGIVGVPLLCAAVVFLLFRFVLFLGYVPSASMEPTISAESLILGSRIYGELQQGDIVVFEKDGRYLVKRIAGVPGDIIYLDDEAHSAVINEGMEAPDRVLIVPADSFFLLGDNSDISIDSRFWDDPFVLRRDIWAKIK